MSPATVYTASKTRHADRWRVLRADGVHVISTWIDEARPGETKDKSDLYLRCIREAFLADVTLVYAEPGEVMRGALIEMGATLAGHGEVWCVGPDEAFTFLAHPRVHRKVSLEEAVAEIRTMYGGLRPCRTGCGQIEDPRFDGYCDGCAP